MNGHLQAIRLVFPLKFNVTTCIQILYIETKNTFVHDVSVCVSLALVALSAVRFNKQLRTTRVSNEYRQCGCVIGLLQQTFIQFNKCTILVRRQITVNVCVANTKESGTIIYLWFVEITVGLVNRYK